MLSIVYHVLVLEIVKTAVAFGARPDISARSVVVTVFGDSVRPAGGSIWLSDLIGLIRPFGFSDRLLRTSITRLTHEGWFATERVGRQSRYRLTSFGETEFDAAESRIYRQGAADWTGDWTLVFTGLIEDREAAALVDKHLSSHGFRSIAPGVTATPGSHRSSVDEVADQLGVRSPVTALSRFEDVDAFLGSSGFVDRAGLPDVSRAYSEFIDRYETFDSKGPTPPEAAFLLQTMVVHDLRRTRLADPDLPAELLPERWAGAKAFELAGSIYRTTSGPTGDWLAHDADLVVDPTVLEARFA